MSMEMLASDLGEIRQHYRQLSQDERESEHGKFIHSAIVVLDAGMKKINGEIGYWSNPYGNYPNKYSNGQQH